MVGLFSMFLKPVSPDREPAREGLPERSSEVSRGLRTSQPYRPPISSTTSEGAINSCVAPAVSTVCSQYAEGKVHGRGQARSLRLACSQAAKNQPGQYLWVSGQSLDLPRSAPWPAWAAGPGRQSPGFRALSVLGAHLSLEVLTASMLHGQPIDGGHVHLHAWWHAEFYLL